MACQSGSHMGCHMGSMSHEHDSSMPLKPILATRSCLPGTYTVPEAPTPQANPNFTPLLVTHCRPSGPSATYGILSFISRGASDVNRSGGSQIMSRWQSAEIRL